MPKQKEPEFHDDLDKYMRQASHYHRLEMVQRRDNSLMVLGAKIDELADLLATERIKVSNLDLQLAEKKAQVALMWILCAIMTIVVILTWIFS